MQKEKDYEHDVRIDALYSKGREQDFKIKAQAAKDAEHDFRLNSVDSVNELQDDELHRQSEKDREHDARLEKLEKLCANLAARVEVLEAQLKK